MSFRQARRRSSGSRPASSGSRLGKTPRGSSRPGSSHSTGPAHQVRGCKLMNELGEGAFGTVWSATLRGRPCAAKCIPKRKNGTKNKLGYRSGLTELRAAARWWRPGGVARHEAVAPNKALLLEWFGSQNTTTGSSLSEQKNGSRDRDRDRDRDVDTCDGGLSPEAAQSCVALVDNPGLAHVPALLAVNETPTALWLFFERGGLALGSQMWSMRGEFRGGERVYRVNQSDFWHAFFEDDCAQLKKLLRCVLEVLELTSACGLVHADLKPDNILVTMGGTGGQQLEEVQVIDFGSSMTIEELHRSASLKSATPEYVPPEYLDAVTDQELLASSPAHALDIWSLGMIFLEIAAGFPLWFPYKSRVLREGCRDFWTRGLLAVTGREGKLIMRRQMSIVQDVAATLRKCPGKGLSRNDLAVDLLQCMLEIEPTERITPREALLHPFLST